MNPLRSGAGKSAALNREISKAKADLDMARLTGDQLKIDLAEAALNDLLERLCDACNA